LNLGGVPTSINAAPINCSKFGRSHRRKPFAEGLFILDLGETDAWHILSFEAAILARGVVYWLIRDRDRPDRAAD
jgi:hypothetical protein